MNRPLPSRRDRAETVAIALVVTLLLMSACDVPNIVLLAIAAACLVAGAVLAVFAHHDELRSSNGREKDNPK